MKELPGERAAARGLAAPTHASISAGPWGPWAESWSRFLLPSTIDQAPWHSMQGFLLLSGT